MITTEKRKNSDIAPSFSLGFAIVLLLGGILMGMTLNHAGVVSNSTAESLALEAQATLTDIDLSGEWIGTTTEDYNNNARYDYRIVITQDGNTITGMSYLDMTDSEVYSESPISGTLEGNVFTYTETSTTVLENHPLDAWCLADTTVTYQVLNGQEMLVGTWDESDTERAECAGIEGRVILTRQVAE